MLKRLSFLLPLTLFATFATAQTPSGCQTSNSSINGAYGFTAAAVPLGGVIMTPPGTTQTYSNTPVGKLISGVNAGVPFSASGILYFDGQGNITASLSSAVSGQVKVGTYTVNGDCTMSVTLTDALNTAPTSPTNITPTFATAKLIGLVVGAGSEIILTEQPTTPLVNGLFASPLAIQMVRAQPFGCSTASLSGSYGLIGPGIATSTITQAATFIAVVFLRWKWNCDGANGSHSFVVGELPDGRHVYGEYRLLRNHVTIHAAERIADGEEREQTPQRPFRSASS